MIENILLRNVCNRNMGRYIYYFLTIKLNFINIFLHLKLKEEWKHYTKFVIEKLTVL